MLPKGSILLTSRAPIGNVAIAGRDMCTNQGFKSLVPGKGVDSAYLYHCMNFMSSKLQSLGNGATFKEVSKKVVEEFQIPLLPLEEQKRIAAILDKADAIRRKRQQVIDLTDQLLRSVFLDMFGDPVTNPKGWPVKPLPELLFFQEGPGVRNWQFTDSGVKLLNVRNIVGRKLNLENTERYISEDEAKGKYSHFLAEEGDLVMASSGVTWGKTAWVEKHHLPLCMNTSTIRFRPLDDRLVTKNYMEGFLNSDSFVRQIDRLITGSAQPNFGPSHLSQVDIILPPEEVQNKFNEIQEKILKQKKKEEILLCESENLFSSLKQYAFRGELTNQPEAA